MFDGIHPSAFGTSYVKDAMSGYSTGKIVRAKFKLTADNSMDGSIFSDGTLMCSVLDLISIANKSTWDNHTHSKQVWCKFRKHPIHADELARLLKYDETEYRSIPAMSIADLKRLLEILPDTRKMDSMTQTKHREALGATLKRYIDGDESMVLFSGSKLDARLALTLRNIEASLSGAANAASSVKINAPAVIEAEIEDTSAISKFFLDPDNIALTDEHGTAWWHLPAFNQAASFDGNCRPALSETWSRLLNGPFKGQFKDPRMNDVQYVQKDRIALELSETKAGPDFTPVSTILGLQKVWNLRRMNQEELVLAATKAAASGMSDAEARCRFGPKFVPPLAADEELAWTLCEIEQQSRSNGASATSGKQAGDSTSRIKAVHISGLLALNGAPSNANSPWSAWSHDQVLGMCA